MANASTTATTQQSDHSSKTANGYPINGYAVQYNGNSDLARREASDHGRYVSKEEYWAIWYEADPSYEWNNGYLETKPMPNQVQLHLFHWFLEIMRQYVATHQNAELMSLEIGFSMTVPDPDKLGTMKEAVRKPDLAAIRHDNPVTWLAHERSYRGTCDLCVEAISDSSVEEIKRDTEIKKSEYEFAGVQEYYILDPSNQHMHFYQRTPAGVYVELQPDQQGVIRSQVLPGFQFRHSDLKRQPHLEDLALDEVYRGYVLLRYQAAEARAAAEHQRAEAEHQRAQQYAARLRELGIEVEE